jgi:hypothetical protein
MMWTAVILTVGGIAGFFAAVLYMLNEFENKQKDHKG